MFFNKTISLAFDFKDHATIIYLFIIYLWVEGHVTGHVNLDGYGVIYLTNDYQVVHGRPAFLTSIGSIMRIS